MEVCGPGQDGPGLIHAHHMSYWAYSSCSDLTHLQNMYPLWIKYVLSARPLIIYGRRTAYLIIRLENKA